ncbi:MAG: magnesium transporter [Porticoccus sp.]|jgi:magnesium transporter|uniref:magnesium transporter n=2 Tax=Porticoccus TaxID=1123967 RepID=UPI000562BA70|nr:magnesium transporter [Porticoccus sp.]|tara:strand:- start:2113 stop:3471 length:1359 start_codon:yes stop_codon:yes gene_type:complete
MQGPNEKFSHLSRLASINEMMNSSDVRLLRHMLNNLSPGDIADQIESAPPKARRVLWDLVDRELEGEVIGELSEELRGEILSEMESHEVASLTEGLDPDDIADILQQLPDQVIPEVLQAMSSQDRLRVERVLTYNEDTAGGLMNTDTITVRPDLTIDVVLRYLRRHEEIPDITDNIFVVNREDTFLGTLPLTKLLTASPNITVREMMVTDAQAITADMPDSQVALLFEKNDWVSAPVVGADHKLLGRITIDDVVDVIIEDAAHSLLGLAGLSDEEETFASVKRTAPRRAVWLGMNLITAILASSVINIFEATIEKVVALAILMPIVASMGGVAGSQTLTVVIRGMALGQISKNNMRWLLSKEFAVGALNGMLWALVMGGVAALWFNDPIIAFIIAAAMAINLISAAVAGTLLPVFLKKCRIDPALAGSVALTTVTDVVGFLSFLGLATLFYS